MDGAGIMNLPTNVGGPTSQDGLDSYAPLIASQQAARDVGYPQFTRELLSTAGSEIDPQAVQEFLMELREAGMTPEDLAVIRRVVEAVFNDPNNYQQVREQLLAEGVPEDLLPPTFDIEFFTALRIAAEEGENILRESRPMDQEMPVEMAEGGIVDLPQMKPIARELAAMGRQGDTMLAHITPQEAMMLKRMGGSGTINPYTGLPEFFSLKKVFRSVSKAVSKFAKSTVGRIAITVALGAFLGPAAAQFLGVSSAAGVAAVSGFVGAFGSGILAGDGLKASLTNGLKGAAVAGGLSAITGGSAALQSRPDLYGNATPLQTLKNTANRMFSTPLDEINRLYGTEAGASQAQVAPIEAAPTADVLSQVNPTSAELMVGDVPGAMGVSPDPFASQTANADFLARRAVDPTTLDYSDQIMAPAERVGIGPRTTPMDTTFSRAVASPPQVNVPDNLGAPFPGQAGGLDYSVAGQNAPSTWDKTKNFWSENFSPNRPGIQPPSLQDAVAQVKAEYTNAGLSVPSDDVLMSEARKLVSAQTPGFFTKYGPMAGLAGTGLAASGAFDNFFTEPQKEGETYEQYMARRQEAINQFAGSSPEFFGSLASYSPYRGTRAQPSYSFEPVNRPYMAARGSGPEGVENFPRKNGHISGPGTGTSDDVPAMLSDGEFVFTAQAVRNMGGGSRRKGAAKMYKLMKMLEGGPVGKTAKA